jgi:3-deoxy-D-manno-octulosonic-acid transferase
MHRCAVLTGPNVHNFEEAYTTLLEAGACIEVATRQDLTNRARMLFRDEKARKELLTRAQAELDEMRGALDTTLDALEAYLPGAKEKRRAS